MPKTSTTNIGVFAEFHFDWDIVESKMGAVVLGFRWLLASLSIRRLSPTCHDSVSHPRLSNRTCGATASGFPTGFTIRHTAGGISRWMHSECNKCHQTFTLRYRFLWKVLSYQVFSRPKGQSPLLISFENMPEVRALPSAGITRPPR